MFPVIGPRATGPGACWRRCGGHWASCGPNWPIRGPVFLPWAGWSLTRDDFPLTRMMELVVHADDLAVSIRIPAVVLPDEPPQLAIDLLARLAMYEHGPPAVLRTLSRAERAPKSISAL